MAIDRRTWLAAATACAWPVHAVPATRLAAAWRRGDGFFVGVLRPGAGQLEVAASVPVPTRAHGLLQLTDGSLVAIARRPGDWLLHWRPGAAARFVWAEPGRTFNGHAIAVGGGRRLLASETDVETGEGALAVFGLPGFERLATWPTHGMDPHALLADGGSVLVANGGVPTRPETGRARHDLHRMDSSLVRLDGTHGALQGQWRLDDTRLSLRHLARNGGRFGVALQAEHDDPHARHAAPVLAVFDGGGLRPIFAPEPLAGYAGDIVPWRDGFALSGPRADAVWCWRADGTSLRVALDGVCALAAGTNPVWAAGTRMTVRLGAPRAMVSLPAGLELDNHWIVLS